MIFEKTINFEPTSLKRHRHTLKGRTYDPSAKDKKKFIQLINLPIEKMKHPIKCVLKFYSSRPKSHYRSGKYSHILKDSSPIYNTSKKDIDNMAKFILDALNNKLYIDDCQIIKLECEKLYSEDIGKIYMKFTEIIKEDDDNEKIELKEDELKEDELKEDELKEDELEINVLKKDDDKEKVKDDKEKVKDDKEINVL